MKSCKLIFRGGVALVLLCLLNSCTLVKVLTQPQGDGSGGSRSLAETRAERRYDEWCSTFSQGIISQMCAYYEAHPERFKPTGHGEEIEIAGFAAFVKYGRDVKTETRGHADNPVILDPWNEPVRFVQDLNMDGIIEADGERRFVLQLGNSGLNQGHHFGVLKNSPFKGPYGQPTERIFAATY